jgi:hypothetical protein
VVVANCQYYGGGMLGTTPATFEIVPGALRLKI